MLSRTLADSGSQIARDTDLHGNLPVSQFFHQIGILAGAESVPDPFRMKIERSPDGFRRTRLSGVRCEVQSVIRRVSVDAAKQFRRSFDLISSNANADYVAILVANRELKNFLRLFHSEVPRSVKNPKQGNSKLACAARASAFQAYKKGGEILFAIKADAHRHVNFRMQAVLSVQSLHQAIRDEFIVVGAAP